MKQANKLSFDKGDRIEYSYQHSLNSKSKTTITKHGVFVRKVKRKGSTFEFDPNPKVVIKLDCNKRPSTVYMSQIKRLK